MTTTATQGPAQSVPPQAPGLTPQAGNTGAAVNVTGDGNVSMAGVFTVGDVTIYSSQEHEFTSLKLDEYEPPYFPSPRRIDHFAQVMRTHRMLVLAGTSGVDKSDLARHIAWYFRDLLANDPAAPVSTIGVMEWIRNPNTQRLLLQIQKATNPTIFLLPEVSGRDLRAEEITRLQQITNHYIVISTTAQPQDWKLPEATRSTYWCDLATDDLFDPQELEQTLIARMVKVREALPQGLVESAVAGQPLDGTMTLKEVIARLKTLNRILVFVYELRGQTQLRAGFIDSLVADIAQRDTTTLDRVIADWYRTMLAPREQLLALNASFFGGLADDQFFAAVEFLFERVWRKRDPRIAAYDYNDLADIDLFYYLTETKSEGRLVETRVPNQRYFLLQAAWNSSRRQILAALPELVKLVRASVGNVASNPELFDRPARRNQLRTVIGETISDIGLIDATAVQRALIELAADENIQVQAVAAAAIARWRYFDQDAQLFELLNTWQLETRFLDLFMEVLRGRQHDQAAQGRAFIRATAALAVGYAAEYDPPNQLSDALCTLFVELSEDVKPLVRDRFRRYTLQLVVPRHLEQIRADLRKMTRFPEFVRWIAISLSNAYKVVPGDVMRTLAEWSNESMTRGVATPNPKELTLRETTLATIALTYGEIDYEETEGPLTADEGFERLKLILNGETHPFVRRAAIIALSLQATRNFERVEPFLQRSLADVTDEERDEIAGKLFEIYQEQRSKQEGGDEVAVVNERRYPIWFGERPPTQIELALLRWIKEAAHSQAQQVAIRAQVRFAELLDQSLDNYTKQRKTERDRKPDTTSPVPTTVAQASPGWFVTELAPRLATIGAPQYLEVIRGLLPEAVKQQKARSTSMGFVIDHLARSQDAEIKQIAPRLRSAIGYANNGCLIIGMGLFLVFVVLCVLLRLLSGLGG